MREKFRRFDQTCLKNVLTKSFGSFQIVCQVSNPMHEIREDINQKTILWRIARGGGHSASEGGHFRQISNVSVIISF